MVTTEVIPGSGLRSDVWLNPVTRRPTAWPRFSPAFLPGVVHRTDSYDRARTPGDAVDSPAATPRSHPLPSLPGLADFHGMGQTGPDSGLPPQHSLRFVPIRRASTPASSGLAAAPHPTDPRHKLSRPPVPTAPPLFAKG